MPNRTLYCNIWGASCAGIAAENFPTFWRRACGPGDASREASNGQQVFVCDATLPLDRCFLELDRVNGWRRVAKTIIPRQLFSVFVPKPSEQWVAVAQYFPPPSSSIPNSPVQNHVDALLKETPMFFEPGRFRTRAGSSPCVFQESRRQSWAFVSSGGFWRRRSTRTETENFWAFGMSSTPCIFDVFQIRTLGSSACSEARAPFSSFFMGSYSWKNRF